MFLEILKAILMGIVEGITEWLPISSTGHMILVEQVVKFNASEEFMSMFRVVIQLGAILAVVVLFWNKLWPFGLRQGKVISKPSVWNLWFKVVAATLPVLVISPLDDWMEAHFYNYITVAAMLILYGVLFLVVENRRIAPHVMRLDQITYRDALLIGVWQCLAIIPGTSRSGATIVGGLLKKSWRSAPAAKSASGAKKVLVNTAEYASYWNYGHRIVLRKGGPTKGLVKGTYLLEKGVSYIDRRLVALFEAEVQRIRKEHESGD